MTTQQAQLKQSLTQFVNQMSRSLIQYHDWLLKDSTRIELNFTYKVIET